MENPQNKIDLRQENKYLISLSKINIFEKKIINLGFKLNHLPNIINNIYFDTNLMKSALENIEGDEKRAKYRIRWYNNDDNFVLEKKIKLSSSGYKEKESLVSKDYRSAIFEVTELIKQNPVIKNSYFRKYYIKEDIRITIDTELKFYLPTSETFKSYFNSIVEIKYSTNEIHNLFDKLDIETQLTKFSKYITGLEAFGRI
jgi:hypothetical protein